MPNSIDAGVGWLSCLPAFCAALTIDQSSICRADPLVRSKAHTVRRCNSGNRRSRKATVRNEVGVVAIQRAVDALHGFVVDVSHELRTLNLLRYASIDLNSEYRANVARVHKAQHRDVQEGIEWGSPVALSIGERGRTLPLNCVAARSMVFPTDGWSILKSLSKRCTYSGGARFSHPCEKRRGAARRARRSRSDSCNGTITE